MILQIRKIITAPTIKNEIIQICQEQGITPTDYAYELIREDITKRIECRRSLENQNTSPLLEEIKKVLQKYSK